MHKLSSKRQSRCRSVQTHQGHLDLTQGKGIEFPFPDETAINLPGPIGCCSGHFGTSAWEA